MQEIRLTNPQFGYRIEVRQTKVNRDLIPYLLTPEKQKKITRAVRGDNDVTITKHVIVCSACGKETPAYAQFVKYGMRGFKSRSQAEIERWATDQTSLFEEQPEVLSFNTPVEKVRRFICPHCGAVLTSGERSLDITIRTKKRRIVILRRLDFKDFFSVKWLNGFQTSECDLYETITFNLRNGHTYVSLESGAGTKLAVRDISNADLSTMSGDPVFELFQTYKSVYRKLRSIFSKCWNGLLPFSALELNLEKYRLLTKFIGFDRAFYNALPFSNHGDCIEQSFTGTARRLHRANWVPALFETTQLPNIKSVRKIIFSNPALLFYQKELETIWQILNDPNIFRAFLESEYSYRELAALHKYPGMAAFYQEVAAEVGHKALCEYLSKGNRSAHPYAISYLMLSDREKRIERDKWTSRFLSKIDDHGMTNFGSPISVPVPPSIKDADTFECRIDGYSFIRLSNSKEYVTAGNELQNCLRNWEWFRGNVYGVVKSGKYVAAIEIVNGTVIQAHTYRNGEMDEDKQLFSAFSIWKERNGLQ